MFRTGGKRRFITLEEKVRVIDEIETNPKTSRAEIAKRLGIPVTTLKSIYVKKDEIRRYAAELGPSGAKRGRSQNGMYADLERVLFEWIQEQKDSKRHVTGTHFKEKALQVATSMGVADVFKASSGWVDKFRKRHGIVGRGFTEGRSLADDEAVAGQWLESIPDLTKNYKLRDVYSFGETELVYNVTDDSDSDAQCKRLVVLAGVNADGSDKLPLLIVGTDEQPLRPLTSTRCPLEPQYVCHSPPRITFWLFREQLKKLDDRMHMERRKILVLADIYSDQVIDLHNIQLEFFPPLCRGRVRPLQLGISDAIKVRYEQLLAQKAISKLSQRGTLAPEQVNTFEVESKLGKTILRKAADDMQFTAIASLKYVYLNIKSLDCYY